MLIVGGSGNRGAVVGAFVVWALWTLSGGVLREIIPAQHQARAASLQVVLIGILLMAILLLRPRGLLGEEAVVSRPRVLRLKWRGRSSKEAPPGSARRRKPKGATCSCSRCRWSASSRCLRAPR